MRKLLQAIKAQKKIIENLKTDSTLDPIIVNEHQKILQGDISRVEEFVKSLSPDLQKFVSRYYFENETDVSYDAERIEINSNRPSCDTYRKTVEREADRWSKKH